MDLQPFVLFRALVRSLVWLLLVGTSQVAVGQGTAPDLPDPISTVRLHRLLEDVFPVDDARWPAAEAAHDEYLRRARVDLAPLRASTLTAVARSCATANPDPQDLAAVRRFGAALAAEENRLFDAIAALAGNERQAEVERARARRGSERVRDLMGSLNGVRSVGIGLVGEFARRHVVDPVQREAIAEPLRLYEYKLAPRVRRAAEHTLDSYRDAARAVRDAGLPDFPPADPAAAEQWWRIHSDAGAAERAKANAELVAIQRLDRDLLAKLAAGLSFDVHQRVRYDATVRSSPLRRCDSEAWIEVLFQLALRSPELDASDKAAALAEYEFWTHADEAMTANIPPFGMTADEREAFQAAHEARRLRSNERLTELMNSKESWVANVRDRWRSLVNGRTPYELAPFDDGFLFEQPTPAPYDHSRRFRPRPIAKARVEALVERLRLDEGQCATALNLQEDHRALWNDAMNSASAKVLEAESSLWASRRQSDNSDGTPQEMIDEIVNLRMAVLAEAERLDDAFYANLRAVLAGTCSESDEDEIALSRLSRRLECLGTGDWSMYVSDDQRNRPVDPVAVVDTLGLDADQRANVRTALLSQSETLLANARSRAKAHAGQEWPSQSDEPMTIRLTAERAVRAAFADAIATLPEETRFDAEVEYERRAHPEFFADPRAPFSLLDRAERLPNLDDERRGAVNALRLAATNAYGRLAIAVGDARRSAPEADRADLSALHSKRRLLIAGLVFDRDESSARTVAALRRLLTPEEQASVRGLNDYERRVETVPSVFIRFVD